MMILSTFVHPSAYISTSLVYQLYSELFVLYLFTSQNLTKSVNRRGFRFLPDSQTVVIFKTTRS